MNVIGIASGGCTCRPSLMWCPEQSAVPHLWYRCQESGDVAGCASCRTRGPCSVGDTGVRRTLGAFHIGEMLVRRGSLCPWMGSWARRERKYCWGSSQKWNGLCAGLVAQQRCCSVAQACLTLVTPWTAAHQVPLSMGFSRQEYRSGLLFPSPGDLLRRLSGKGILISWCGGFHAGYVDECSCFWKCTLDGLGVIGRQSSGCSQRGQEEANGCLYSVCIVLLSICRGMVPRPPQTPNCGCSGSLYKMA